MLKSRDGLSFVDIEDILLVQREERQTVIYTVGDGRYVTGEGPERTGRAIACEYVLPHPQILHREHRPDRIGHALRPLDVHRGLCGTKRDALITHERFDELQKLFS